jgi:hypothetical protein
MKPNSSHSPHCSPEFIHATPSGTISKAHAEFEKCPQHKLSRRNRGIN